MSANFSRRDFLKGGVAFGFVSVGGILVPRTSEAAFPLMGALAVSLLQVFSAYLAYRGRSVYNFKELYRPYEQLTDVANFSQYRLFSEKDNQPIQFNYSKTFSEPSSLKLLGGDAYMSNNYQSGQYNPAELEIARRYEQDTGYGLFPNSAYDKGLYTRIEPYQRDYYRERSQDLNSPLRKFGEFGEDYVIKGIRKFTDDKGKSNNMVALQTRQDPKTTRIAYLV